MVAVFPMDEAEERTKQTVLPMDGRGAEDDFGPEAGWEFDFARKHPLLYPTVRTAADIKGMTHNHAFKEKP